MSWAVGRATVHPILCQHLCLCPFTGCNASHSSHICHSHAMFPQSASPPFQVLQLRTPSDSKLTNVFCPTVASIHPLTSAHQLNQHQQLPSTATLFSIRTPLRQVAELRSDGNSCRHWTAQKIQPRPRSTSPTYPPSRQPERQRLVQWRTQKFGGTSSGLFLINLPLPSPNNNWGDFDDLIIRLMCRFPSLVYCESER